MALFDVLINVATRHVPSGITRDAAIALVGAAVQAEAGAGRVLVVWCDDVDSVLPHVVVMESTSGIKLNHDARARLEVIISTTARRALFPGLATVDTTSAS